MITIKRGVTVAALALGVAQAMPALATNGTNSEGFGPKDRGMGGAGVARATETQSIVNNPAAVVALPARMDIALGLFSPNNRGFELEGNNLDPDGPTGPAPVFPGAFDQSQTSDKDIFPIPFFGYSSRIDDDSAWAFTVSALGGLNTNYGTNFGSKAPVNATGDTGVDLRQMFLGATYGARLGNGMAWGVTLSYDLQQFEAKGLQAFAGATSDADALTDEGSDTSTGIGLKLGLQGELANGGTWGASYRFKSEMSEFDSYAGLFPNQGELDIAPTITLGVALPVGDDMTLAIDYHYIDYEQVDAISNSTSIFTDDLIPFGADDGPGFGWKSISVLKAGVEWETSEMMTWRAGINIGEDPLQSDEFSTAFLVPATSTTHLAGGFTRKLDATTEITGVWVHTLKREESGDFALAFGGGDLSVDMEQNFIEIGYGKLF